jgi:2TM domain
MTEDDPRQQAIDRLQAKRGIGTTAVAFAGITVVLVVIWLASGRGFFWPIFAIAGFAIALGMQAYNVYGRKPITEEDIQREMQRGGGGV